MEYSVGVLIGQPNSQCNIDWWCCRIRWTLIIVIVVVVVDSVGLHRYQRNNNSNRHSPTYSSRTHQIPVGSDESGMFVVVIIVVVVVIVVIRKT